MPRSPAGPGGPSSFASSRSGRASRAPGWPAARGRPGEPTLQAGQLHLHPRSPFHLADDVGEPVVERDHVLEPPRGDARLGPAEVPAPASPGAARGRAPFRRHPSRCRSIRPAAAAASITAPSRSSKCAALHLEDGVRPVARLGPELALVPHPSMRRPSRSASKGPSRYGAIHSSTPARASARRSSTHGDVVGLARPRSPRPAGPCGPAGSGRADPARALEQSPPRVRTRHLATPARAVFGA